VMRGRSELQSVLPASVLLVLTSALLQWLVSGMG
jgi:hypothetical protein